MNNMIPMKLTTVVQEDKRNGSKIRHNNVALSKDSKYIIRIASENTKQREKERDEKEIQLKVVLLKPTLRKERTRKM